MRPPDGSDIACNFDCGTESRGREVGRGPLVGLAHVEEERVAARDVGLDRLEVRRQSSRGEASASGSGCALEKRIARARHYGGEEDSHHHLWLV